MIKNLVKKFKERNLVYGAITSEIVPVFNDSFGSTNKTFTEFNLLDDTKNYPIEKQGEDPVIFKKGFETNGIHHGDLEYMRNDLKAGMFIKVLNGGCLGNLTSVYKIVLITNNFIYLQDIESIGDKVSIKSHEEIGRIREQDCLEVC